MPKRAIYSMAGLAAVVFLAVNVLIYAMSRNTVPRQIAKRLDNTPVVDCLALGNSLMQAGFDERSFEKSSALRGVTWRAFNAGLGSSSPVEHLILLRRALHTHRKVDTVFYGFFDFQLTTLPHYAQGDLIGNRAMLYYFEPTIVPALFDWTLPERIEFYTTRLFPALEERGTIWEKVELARRRMANTGMPAERNNRFGRQKDFALLESDSTEAFERECEREISGRQPLSKPVAEMTRLARDRGSRFVALEMPMHPEHRKRYYETAAWRRYRSYIRGMLESAGASYVEASDWIEDERMFEDHLHASGPGAKVFSSKLGSLGLM